MTEKSVEESNTSTEQVTEGCATATEPSNPLRSPPADRSVPELLRFGVINLDKPAGPSAHQVSTWVRDMVNDALSTLDPEGATIDGVAHAGTLDPKVTGCLPMLTGVGTRMARVYLEGRKQYVAGVFWG